MIRGYPLSTMFFAAPCPISPTPIYPMRGFSMTSSLPNAASRGPPERGAEAQARFEKLRPDRKRPAQEKVERGDDRIDDHRLKGRVGHQLAGAREFDEADDRRDRRRLHELDQETDGRRDGDTHGLRQDDVAQLLVVAQRQRRGRLPLRARYR